MPTILTHAFIAGACSKVTITDDNTLRKYGIALFCSIIPDADVIGFKIGIHYGAFWGHRGFFHSIFFAIILALMVVVVFYNNEKIGSKKWRKHFLFFSLMGASHGILDALTNGGLGIALLSPLYNARIFFPWTPIPVSPIGLKSFFMYGGFSILLWEILIIWLPALLIFYGYKKIKCKL